MDGTLLDTIGDLTVSVNHCLAIKGFPQRTVAEVNSFIGNGLRKTLMRSSPAGTPEEVIDEMLAEINRFYPGHMNDSTKPFAGIMECLSSLKSAGVKLAVTSNKRDPEVRKLCGLHFPGIFDVIVGSGAQLPRKPAPGMVDYVLKTVNLNEANSANEKITLAETVYVGDSEVDVQTAANSGLKCICVTWGSRSEEQLVKAGAGLVVDTAGALTKALLGSYQN